MNSGIMISGADDEGLKLNNNIVNDVNRRNSLTESEEEGFFSDMTLTSNSTSSAASTCDSENNVVISSNNSDLFDDDEIDEGIHEPARTRFVGDILPEPHEVFTYMQQVNIDRFFLPYGSYFIVYHFYRVDFF